MFNMMRACPPGSAQYTVQPGDSLYSVSKKFNISLQELINANPLENPNYLFVGYTLCIPKQVSLPPCPAENYYSVKAGDTLYNIAQQNGVSLGKLIASNPGINPYLLSIGQMLCIPKKVCPPGTITHVVTQGETLNSIAARYYTTVRELIYLNPGINPDLINIGDIICVPINAPE